ncbi:MAG: hypothetical protein Q4E38_07485 [Eubacteriales bacterium]|nr:hypothetical protein [Eubacteriales bacterium]
MKHPALTRVMAIALVVLCLTMAAAGALGLRQTERDRRITLEDMERLRVRIEEYETLSAELAGAEDYASLSGRLGERQKAYDKESSQHRSELGTFTATQYGVGVGLEAIDEAEAQFAAYKAKFTAALTSFQDGLDQIDTLFGYLWTLYDTAVPILDSADKHLAMAHSFSAVMDEGGELRYSQVTAAYDELIGIADESAETAGTLRGLEPTLDALAAFDIGSLASMAGGMAELQDSFGSFGDVPLDAYQQYGVQVDFDMDRIVQLKQTYDQSWAAVKQGLALYDEAAARAEETLRELTGMDAEALRAEAGAVRADLAAHGEEPLDPEASASILAAWRSSRSAVMQGLDTAGAGLAEIRGAAEQIHSLLSGLQAQFKGLREMLAKAKEMIAAAEEAMFQARAMIWQQMGLQREKEEALWDRKDVLDEEALALQELQDAAQTRQEKEQRQKTLRSNLLSRDGIKERSDAGEELGSAAQTFLEETVRTAEDVYARRRIACLLMLFGALYSLIGIPAAFEASKSRLMLTMPVLHCLGCAAGAEQILWQLGRGLSYSCLAVMAFALLQLLVSRPKKKRKMSNSSKRSA